MAKMATSVNKPDGCYIVDENSAVSFIDSFHYQKYGELVQALKQNLPNMVYLLFRN